MFFFVPVLFVTDTCLIGCRTTPTDLPTSSNSIETLLSTSIGWYSTKYNETCTVPSGTQPVSTVSGTMEYYEYQVMRTDTSVPVYLYQNGACASTDSSFTLLNYLDTYKSGAISSETYPYTCQVDGGTIPSDSFSPLPNTRLESCLYGIQLVPSLPTQFGAAFWNQKQQVVYGFDTTFYFTVLNKNTMCPISQSASGGGPASKSWCIGNGGRGFAFIVQNEGSPGVAGVGDDISFKISTFGSINLGYNFPRNLAIEFDYYFDPDSNDPNWNHIAVMVPTSKQPSEKDNTNSANHNANLLAIADGVTLPPLSENLHKVRIRYDVGEGNIWQSLMGGRWMPRPLTQNQQLMLAWWANNRLGILSVYLDDRVVIRTFLDLASIVQADSVATYSPTVGASGVPNAASPGSAWVGFAATTGSDQLSSPIILDWTYTSNDQCPSGGSTNIPGSQYATITCTAGQIRGTPNSLNPPLVRFTLRNIARTNVQVFFTMAASPKPIECENSSLGWNEIHPYFLGCERPLAVGSNIDQIMITDTTGARIATVTDPALIDRDYQSSVFLRRDTPEYCVIEHEYDYYRMFFAECDCEFCVRIFDNQALYSVFYSEICSQRYTYACSCFEVSQMTDDAFYTDYSTKANPWKYLTQTGYAFTEKLMQFQQHTICRGCSFDFQCNLMLKSASCATPFTQYRVGNPLKPVIGGNFQDWNRGSGASDGLIKGDTCNCGDQYAEVMYTNTRGDQQTFQVYLLSDLVTNVGSCTICLTLPGRDCSSTCGYPNLANYLHWPAGQACSTCILSAPRLLDLTIAQVNELRTCIYANVQEGTDPWVGCESTAAPWMSNPSNNATDFLYNLLNGVVTHYIAECPGRDFDTVGGVCAPNLFVSNILPMQVISRESALQYNSGYFPSWWPGIACMNAKCELTQRENCYVKLLRFVFEQDSGGNPTCRDLLGSGTGCYLVNSPTFNSTNSAVVLDKEQEQYGYTDPLVTTGWATNMTAKTLEVWASVSTVDLITDLAAANPSGLYASNEWGDDYDPTLAIDDSLETFWQSPTSASSAFNAQWYINFNQTMKNANGYTILWAYRAANFTVEASIDNGINFSVIDRYVNNNLYNVTSASFFKFNALRIVMTASVDQRPAGQDQGMFAYGIFDFQIVYDTEISRLRPVAVTQHYRYPPSNAVDGTYGTWWSTTRRVVQFPSSGEWITVQLGSAVSHVVLARVIFRRGYAPGSALQFAYSADNSSFTTLSCMVSTSCGSSDISCQTVGCDSTVSGQFWNSYSLAFLDPTIAAFNVTVPVGSSYYDDSSIVQIAELELYRRSTSGVSLLAGSCTPMPDCATVNTNGQIVLPINSVGTFSNWQILASIPSGESLGLLTIVFADNNSLPFKIFVTSPTGNTLIQSRVNTAVNSFAIFTDAPSDLTLQITTSSTNPTRIVSISIEPIVRVDLSGSTVTASDSWSADLSPAFPLQGLTQNLVDNDLTTEWRTQIGAPALVGQSSRDNDYLLQFNLGRTLNIDAFFLRFSFASQSFEINGRPPIPSMPGTDCQWIPQFNLQNSAATTTCSGVQIYAVNQADVAQYYEYYQAPVSFGSVFYPEIDVTLSQASAVDTIDDQPVIGLREVQMYSAYVPAVPVSCSAPFCETMYDQNFTSFWTLNSPNAIQVDLDLGALVYVKDVSVWWSDVAGIPPQATISVTQADLPCASATFGLQQTYDPINPSLNVQLIYPSGSATLDVQIRCVRLYFPTAPISHYFSIAEVVIRTPPPSLGATVIDSTLTNPQNALDTSSGTFATASGSSIIQHYLMFQLRPVPNRSQDVWGVQVDMSVSGTVDASSLRIYYCESTVTTATACMARNVVAVIPQQSLSHCVFSPLSCTGCNRVVFALLGDAFSIATFQILASPNEALDPRTVVTFNDDREWNYWPDMAVDGLNTTSWVSELDVTSADFILSFIPVINGTDPLDLPSYSSIATTTTPSQIANLEIDFAYPVNHFELYISNDGLAWTLLNAYPNFNSNSTEITTSFRCNYLKVALLAAEPPEGTIYSTHALDTGSWSNGVFGITAINATMYEELQLEKTASATNQANSANYAISGGLVWMSTEPFATGTYVIGTTTVGVEISGISFVWKVAPGNADLQYVLNGVVASPVPVTTFSDSTGLTYYTAVGSSSVTSFVLNITQYNAFDGIKVAVLQTAQVYVPSVSTVTPTTVTALGTASYLTDGITNNPSFAWTIPSGFTPPATIVYDLPPGTIVGKTIIYWNVVCMTFTIKGVLSTTGETITVFSTTTNSDATVTLLVLGPYSQLTLTMLTNTDMSTSGFSLFEWAVYSGTASVPIVSATQTGGSPMAFGPFDVIDAISPTSTQQGSHTVWMADPTIAYTPSSSVSLTIDLMDVFPVDLVEITWGWVPWDRIGASRSVIDANRLVLISGDCLTYADVTFSFSYNNVTNLDTSSELVTFRCLTVTITAEVVHNILVGGTTKIIGPSIVDINVELDKDIKRRQSAYVVRTAGSWWDFPAERTADNDDTTYWLSQRGASTAILIADLGQVYNIAGIEIDFVYAANQITYSKSVDCVDTNYVQILADLGNQGNATLSGQTYQFQARCVMIALAVPLVQIPNPDDPNGNLQSIFGIATIAISHQVGGGGVFGIEQYVNGAWGTVFDTITFAPFQPNQWNMLSNQQVRTQNVNGAFYQNETAMVHLVATFGQQAVTLYRNGVQFGSSYNVPNLSWNDQTTPIRLVFGVRSSAFAGASPTDQLTLMGTGTGKQTSNLNPFFSGQIKLVSLFSQELYAEEVQGLYESTAFGTRERGCICYDMCPTGSNRHYPATPVPCSGQGICQRQYDPVTGLPVAGICQCSPGFSGDNCENHCSQNGGCCSVDDDCPLSMFCDTPTNSCKTSR